MGRSWLAAARAVRLALLAGATLVSALTGDPFEDAAACRFQLNFTSVYAAQAEAAQVIHRVTLGVLNDPFMFGFRGIGAIDRLVAVAGSFSHVTMLTTLEPREIIYTDINEDQLLVNAAILSLIKVSPTRLSFLSGYFARPESAFRLEALELGNVPEPAEVMEEIRLVPAVKRIALEIYQHILVDSGERVACAYAGLVREFTAVQGEREERRTCDHVLIIGVPFFYNEGQNVTLCSVQYGEGWLASEATYTTVRDRLMRARVEFQHKDLFTDVLELVNPNHRTVLYTSNVFTLGVQRLQTAFQEAVDRIYIFGAGYLHICHFESHFDVNKNDARFKEVGASSSRQYRKHMAALAATALQLEAYTDFVEVTCEAPYGFSEFDEGWAIGELNGENLRVDLPFKRRRNVNPEGFQILDPRIPAKGPPLANSACLLHVLLGSGCSASVFFSTLAAAMLWCQRVIILEHNPDSIDFLLPAKPGQDLAWKDLGWLSPRHFHWLLTLASTNMLGPNDDALVVPTHFECVVGMYDGCRNMIAVLDRVKSPGLLEEPPRYEDFIRDFVTFVDTYLLDPRGRRPSAS